MLSKIIDFVIDFIFLSDMIITFRLVYVNEIGDEEKDLKRIAYNYFRTMFWIDLSATLPLDTILLWMFKSDNPYYQAFGLLKLGRVMRLNKIISFVQVENDIKSVLQVVSLIFFLIVYIHIYGCIWWIIVRDDQTWIPVFESIYSK